MKKYLLTGLCLFLLGSYRAGAQGKPAGGHAELHRQALDTSVYKQWKRLGIPAIAAGGKWVLYNYTEDPQTRYLQNTATGKVRTFSQVRSADFFGSGQWLRYTLAGKQQDTLMLLHLEDGRAVRWTRSPYLVESALSPVVTYTRIAKDRSSTAVICNLATGDSLEISHAGRTVLYQQDKRVFYLKDNQLFGGLLKGKQSLWYTGKVDDFAVDEANQSVSFLSDSAIYSSSLKQANPRQVFDFKKLTPPAGFRVRPGLYGISAQTREIMLELEPVSGTAEKRLERSGGMKSPGFELELWTWNEEVSQRRQRKGAAAKLPPEKYRFIYHLDTRRWNALPAEKSGFIVAPESSSYDYVFQTDPKPYTAQVDWKYNNNVDIYVINVHTGERKLAARDSYDMPRWSPNGKYAILYNAVKKRWEQFDPATSAFKDFSSQIGQPVFDEDQDMPRPAQSYGLAGWADQGNSIVLYDRYDLWVVDMSGKRKPYSLTKGYGRSHQLALRLWGADFDASLDITGPLLLSSFNEQTKSGGFYRLYPGGKIVKGVDEPEYTVKVLSVSPEKVIFTKESFSRYPDLWAADAGFSGQKRLTETNPQQQQYQWGKAKVLNWKNFSGKQNQGLLYLPEDYDPGKTYPVIVDFYETHAAHLQDYIVPEYSTCTINIPTYVSKGFIVFRPDVHFTIGEPGESAYNAVISGTQLLIDKGIADRSRIGVQGHSWSGYEVAYLVTRSNLFKCANIGAGVVNMTYNYFAIRANGAPCMFKYEVEQSRIGKSLWEDTGLYLKNSAIFKADHIQTPLLIFHNDKDGAVAFTQGLDLFLAMRRLQKPAWLLNYKGEGHTLDGAAAQQDWTLRMEQFFEHYLKNKPMPRWMAEGISIDERNRDQKFGYAPGT